MAHVHRRPKAEDDLIEIWLSIASDSRDRADAFLDTIAARLRQCAEHPLSGRARDELMPALRSYVIEPYVVFYMPMDDGIDVVRVLHGARDVPTIFGDA
ncbi:MAG: type II toxin-antitoxin system RelE/ParE family toxin [Planctomycetes bacterium]|nr:type II toxin-antitoxin system RelE/ParE family toxin [Planctomycetota bacterium]